MALVFRALLVCLALIQLVNYTLQLQENRMLLAYRYQQDDLLRRVMSHPEHLL